MCWFTSGYLTGFFAGNQPVIIRLTISQPVICNSHLRDKENSPQDGNPPPNGRLSFPGRNVHREGEVSTSTGGVPSTPGPLSSVRLARGPRESQLVYARSLSIALGAKEPRYWGVYRQTRTPPTHTHQQPPQPPQPPHHPPQPPQPQPPWQP